jgi:hypothetical protein
VISEQDAAARKEQDVATIREQRLEASEEFKEWQYIGRFQSGFAVTRFLNANPPQGAGEAMTTARDDGTVEVFSYR